jgi:hypothetical protein
MAIGKTRSDAHKRATSLKLQSWSIEKHVIRTSAFRLTAHEGGCLTSESALRLLSPSGKPVTRTGLSSRFLKPHYNGRHNIYNWVASTFP